MVFTSEESCHPRLEKLGRKIAKSCEGLPLAIIEVAKLLHKTEKTVEEWTILAAKEDPLIIRSDDDTPLSKALLLSYKMLPQYLKVCFLYMSVFPKKYEILRHKICRLWISEGLIEPGSSEETAHKWLSKLISQSVVLRDKTSSLGYRVTKSCRLHFTFRSLCANEAKEERVFHII